MLRNYVKIALRNLWRNKLYTSLNVGGLAVGVAACLLMALYVHHEFSYDAFHANADRIVRVTTNMTTPESPLVLASSPLPLAPMLKRDYPEVETAVRLLPVSAVVQQGDQLVNEPEVYFADPDLFSVFSYHFLAGNPATALTQPNSAVISQPFAEAYFGKADALGQSVTINKHLYRITGVVASAPSNTDLPIRVLLSKEYKGTRSWLDDDFPCYTYVLFRDTPNLVDFDRKLAQIARKYANPELKAMGAEGYSISFPTEWLKDVHYSQGKMADTPKGSKQYGYLFAFLAIFVLAIALLNYVNLLTAKATERAREVGVRKANGAQRSQLIGQFLFESLLLSALAVLSAVALVQVALPFFNELLGIQLQITGSETVGLAGSMWGIVTLLGGLYPAFVLSGYQPVAVLKGRFGGYGKGAWLRQSVTVFQFVLAVGMIAGVLVVYRQMQFLQQHDPGFTKENRLSISLPDDSTARAGAPAFANSLKSHSAIGDVSLGSGLQLTGLIPMASTTIRTNGRKREIMCNYLFVDEAFLPVLNIRLKAGRNLSAQSKADREGGFLVNEAFVKMAGWQQGVGQSMAGFGHKGKVVGVVRNFHYRSLHNLVEPMALVYNTVPANAVLVQTRPDQLPVIRAIWRQHYPAYPFDYSFLNESLAAQYAKDRVMMMVFSGFAGLTVLVSCLGLFGLVTFSAQRRTKEIGIRKVLGASVVNVVILLSKDFLKFVFIAIFIAAPVAWYALRYWLQNFAYRIEPEWWVFALAGGLSIVLALLTLSFQSVKTALVNPVNSLKVES